MAPRDFFRFPKQKKAMKGRHFGNMGETKIESLVELKIKIQKCFEDQGRKKKRIDQIFHLF